MAKVRIVTIRIFQMLFSAMVCLALLPSPGFGQDRGNGQQKHQDRAPHDDDDRDDDRDHRSGDRDHDRDHQRGSGATITIVFGGRDRDIIRDYYHSRASNLPPGLAKRHGNLPPGLQKHLERNGTLPPGLQKRFSPFPADLERRLPRLPSIYRRGTIGVDIVILDRRTQRIVDVVHNLLGPY
jgi:hypothetical protein